MKFKKATLIILTLLVLITTISAISAAEDTADNSAISDASTDIQTTQDTTASSSTHDTASESTSSDSSSTAQTSDQSTTKSSTQTDTNSMSSTTSSQHAKDSASTVNSKTLTKDSDVKTSDSSYDYNSEGNVQKEVSTEVQNDNTVKTLDSESSASVTSFEELESTIASIKLEDSGDSYTIDLEANSDPTAYDITSTITWDGSNSIKNLTINGNGLTLNGNENYQFMTIGSDYSVTLNNITIINCHVETTRGGTINNAGTLTIINSEISNSTTTNYGGAIYSTGNLTLINTTMEGNHFTGNYGYGGAIYSTNIITIINSSFENNVATMNSGAIYTSGQATISDSKFTKNSGESGGAIYNTGGTLTITNTIFDGNTANSYGAAIDNTGNNAILTLENSEIINSTAGYGAIYLTNCANATITNTTFINNQATTRGGAIHTDRNLTVTNSTFSNNTATGTYGGSIYVTGTNLKLTGCEFTNSTAPRGGVIYNVNSNITISDSKLTDNTATVNGGVLFNDGANCNTTITNTYFSQNTAQTNGAVLYNNYGLITVTESELTNNTGTSGGIVYNGNSGAFVNMTDCNVTYNTATSNGGGIYNDGQTIEISNSNLSYNTAQRGGFIYSTGSGTVTITDSTLIENTASILGYAVYNQGKFTITNNLIQNSVEGVVNQETTILSPIYDTQLSSTEEVTITINDDELTQLPNNGEIKTTYIFTETGETLVVFTYPSYGSSNDIQLIATIQGELILSYTGSTTAGSTVTLTADLSNIETDVNGYVVFKVNGKTIKDSKGNVLKIEVDNKTATYEYTLPYVSVQSDYVVGAIFYGSTIGTIRSDDIILTILLGSANIDLSTEGTLTPGEKVTLKATITDDNQKAVTSGRVVFKLNGVSLKDNDGNILYAYVDENGVATLEYTIPENYSAKDYVLTAVFQADGFERTEINETITLVKTETAIVIDESILTDGSSQDSITITQGENLQLKATIIDQKTEEAMTGTTKVAVKINEKTVIQQYVTDGVIDLTLYTSNFANPTYTITIIASENSKYQESTYEGTLVVVSTTKLANQTSDNGTLLVAKD